MNDAVGGSGQTPDFEAEFARLMQDVEQNRPAAAREPSARERQQAAARRQEQAAQPVAGRHVMRNVLIFVALVGLLAGGAQVYRMVRKPSGASAAAAQVAGTRSASPGAVSASAGSSASATPSASVSVRSAVGATGTATADEAEVRQIPVGTLFPAAFKGSDGTSYTLVSSGALADCVHSDMVAATLAGMFAQSSGCVGGEGALYKDAAKDQFDAFVFTMKDPGDVVSIVSALSSDYSDVEMAPVLPPAGSGLATLGATSGIVQSFAGSGNYLGIFMAQWADGKTTDYQSLENLLQPVANAVSARIG